MLYKHMSSGNPRPASAYRGKLCYRPELRMIFLVIGCQDCLNILKNLHNCHRDGRSHRKESNKWLLRDLKMTQDSVTLGWQHLHHWGSNVCISCCGYSFFSGILDPVGIWNSEGRGNSFFQLNWPPAEGFLQFLSQSTIASFIWNTSHTEAAFWTKKEVQPLFGQGTHLGLETSQLTQWCVSSDNGTPTPTMIS